MKFKKIVFKSCVFVRNGRPQQLVCVFHQSIWLHVLLVNFFQLTKEARTIHQTCWPNLVFVNRVFNYEYHMLFAIKKKHPLLNSSWCPGAWFLNFWGDNDFIGLREKRKNDDASRLPEVLTAVSAAINPDESPVSMATCGPLKFNA